MRTDNGPLFSSLTLVGLSYLAVCWIWPGIRPERIASGRPDQNGRQERMHPRQTLGEALGSTDPVLNVQFGHINAPIHQHPAEGDPGQAPTFNGYKLAFDEIAALKQRVAYLADGVQAKAWGARERERGDRHRDRRSNVSGSAIQSGRIRVSNTNALSTKPPS
jgi:hypothetical protein